MVDPKSGTQDTIDNPNPVPFYLIDPDYRHEKTPAEINLLERKPLGSLVDIAPTILNLIHIPVPQEFIGKNLLIYF
jgi:bisphosphoglycerate-independent phosphoglycerate mutase (AlkP superfamily)